MGLQRVGYNWVTEVNRMVKKPRTSERCKSSIDWRSCKNIPTRTNLKKYTSRHLIVILLKAKDKEYVFKAVREKQYLTYRAKAIWMTADFSSEIREEFLSYSQLAHSAVNTKHCVWTHPGMPPWQKPWRPEESGTVFKCWKKKGLSTQNSICSENIH